MKRTVLIGLLVVVAMMYFGCSTMRGTTAKETGKDALIVTEVKAKLVADEVLKPFTIDVSSYDGVVTLAGIVPSKEAEQRAIQTARGVEGVKSVKSTLQISPSAK